MSGRRRTGCSSSASTSKTSGRRPRRSCRTWAFSYLIVYDEPGTQRIADRQHPDPGAADHRGHRQTRQGRGDLCRGADAAGYRAGRGAAGGRGVSRGAGSGRVRRGAASDARCWSRSGVVPGRHLGVHLAVLPAAGARLPVLRRRPVRVLDRRGWSVQRRMVAGALLFVAGFAAVFVAAGSCSGPRHHARVHQLAIERVLGAVTIVLGLVFMGSWPRCNARPGCTPSRGRGWPGRRCSGWCSGSAGRRASARRWRWC